MSNLRRSMVALFLLLLAACGSEENGTDTGGEAPAPAAEEAGTPAPVVTEQGETYFGIYLSVGEGPDIEDAINYLTEERGLEPDREFAIGDVSCDRGAQEVLGADAGPMRVAVYFNSEEDADAWAATLPAAPIAIAEVQTMCVD